MPAGCNSGRAHAGTGLKGCMIASVVRSLALVCGAIPGRAHQISRGGLLNHCLMKPSAFEKSRISTLLSAMRRNPPQSFSTDLPRMLVRFHRTAADAERLSRLMVDVL